MKRSTLWVTTCLVVVLAMLLAALFSRSLSQRRAVAALLAVDKTSVSSAMEGPSDLLGYPHWNLLQGYTDAIDNISLRSDETVDLFVENLSVFDDISILTMWANVSDQSVQRVAEALVARGQTIDGLLCRSSVSSQRVLDAVLSAPSNALMLVDVGFAGPDLSRLQGCTGLQYLTIDGRGGGSNKSGLSDTSNFDEEALLAILHCPSLNYLSLSHLSVSDELASGLAQSSTIMQIRLQECSISRESLQALKKAIPRTTSFVLVNGVEIEVDE